MLTIYNINQALEQALNDIMESADENGEVDGEVIERFNGLQLKRDELVEQTALYVLNLKNLIAGRKNEINKQKEALEKENRQVERLENYLLATLSGEKFKNERVTISYRKSEKVIIKDADAIPQEFITTKTTYEPNKTLIKNAIKKGEVVAGAEIEENHNIQIK